ncbi:MAG: DinB family protein [Actinomycetota bacterium]|nr:DinB family protein [Actinomycetota bacterium]
MRQADVLLDALASTPADIARAAARCDGEAGRARPAVDQWSAADILNHLVDVERRYQARLRQIVEAERPTLPDIGPDEAHHDPQATCQELAARFRDARQETLAFLRGLPRGGWARRAVHETLGDLRMDQVVRVLVEHDVAHLAQLVEARSRVATIPRGGDVA